MNIINELYNGDIKLKFDTLKHQYSIDGRIIPGATSILGIVAKNSLIYWSAGCAADYFRERIEPGKVYDEVELDNIYRNAKKAHTVFKDDAASIGKITHKWVQDYIEGKNPSSPINEQVRKSVDKFLAWVKKHSVTFLLSEQPCYSIKYDYCGTLDFICKIDGKLYLGDLKTNNAMYKNSMGSQCAAYKMCREEEYGENYAGIVVCRVGKEEGDFESWICEDTKIFEENLLNCLALYKSEEQIKLEFGK